MLRNLSGNRYGNVSVAITAMNESHFGNIEGGKGLCNNYLEGRGVRNQRGA